MRTKSINISRTGVLALMYAVGVSFSTGCFHAGTKTDSQFSATWDKTTGEMTSLSIRDRSKGGGTALLTDPKASQISRTHNNQTRLGGGSSLRVGEIKSLVSTNALETIGDAVETIGTSGANKLLEGKK